MLRINKLNHLLLALLLLAAGTAFSQVLQEKTLDRPYEVRYNASRDFKSFIGVPISELHLFAYRGSENKWEPIPFQIDERDGDTEPNYYVTHNGLLDLEDEFVYMIRDLGDQVPVGVWVDDENAKTHVRYEIKAYDSTATDGKKAGWAYLFRSTTISAKSEMNYMTYDPATKTVKSIFYEAGYSNEGVLNNFLVSPSGGGNGAEILDRQKYYFQGIFPPNLEYWVTEDKFIQTGESVVVGPIRVLRRSLIDMYIMPDSDPAFSNLPLQAKFTPFYLQYSSGGIGFVDQYGVDEIRQSWDFNVNATGMKFHNKHNQDVLVDGNVDVINDTLEHDQLNWMMLTGDQGTILAISDLAFQINNPPPSRRVYFYDNSATNQDDTGDKRSYGEMGIKVTGYRIADTLTYKSQIYFLPANQPHEKGNTVLADFSNPVAEIWSEQNYVTGVNPVKSSDKPEQFRLHQNFPNPFNPETTIGFDVPREARVKITILNILGQKIKTLVDQNFPAGKYQAVWLGDDDSGRKIVSGVYFYQLESNTFRELRKMILMD